MQAHDRKLDLRVGANSHQGKVREENQDRISRFRSPFGDVFVVADGMGGHEEGGLAAELTISGIERHLRDLPADRAPGEALQEAARRANVEIYRRAGGEDQNRKMGATLVLALVSGGRAWIGHAGDSRAYLFRRGSLSQLTNDHTLVQQMLDHDMLTEEEARDHPDASVVTRGFGHEEDLTLDVHEPVELADGDQLLLCSDGLSGYVSDDEIERVMRGTATAQEITDELVRLALRAGGEDNVSVQLLRFGNGASSASLPPLPAPPVAKAGKAGKAARPSAQASWRHWPWHHWLWTALIAALAFVLGMLMPFRLQLPAWLPFTGAEESAEEADIPPVTPPAAEEPTATVTPPGDEPVQEPPGPLRFRIFFGPGSEEVERLLDRIRDEMPELEAETMPIDTSPVERLDPGVYYLPGFEDRARKIAESLNRPAKELPAEWSLELGPLFIKIDGPPPGEVEEPASNVAPAPGAVVDEPETEDPAPEADETQSEEGDG